MPMFEDPTADAVEVQAALRALAHATRSIEDPRQIYSVLGSLTSAVAPLSQSLHQLAVFHDVANQKATRVVSDSRSARSASYRVSWELHRSAEILHHVSESIAHAHSGEATISYDHRDFPEAAQVVRQSIDHGLGL